MEWNGMIEWNGNKRTERSDLTTRIRPDHGASSFQPDANRHMRAGSWPLPLPP